MRLYLLPVSTRRTLLYCHRLNAASTEPQSLMDKVQSRAAKVWAGWESKEKGWQKTVVNYGNYAFRRIPYEEWGLKSVPPLSKKREQEELQKMEQVQVVYPKSIITREAAPRILETLATEREAFHRKKLIWCFVGMPFTAPIALIPVVPNLPFFYLVYRAWSHWRALSGGKHVQFLLKRNLLSYLPSPMLDKVYATQNGPLPSSSKPTTPVEVPPLQPPASSGATHAGHNRGETMLLSQANGKKMTQILELPQLEVELERAIWQVETAIHEQNKKIAQEDSTATSKTPKSSHTTAEVEMKPRKER